MHALKNNMRRIAQGCRRFGWHGLILSWCLSIVGWGLVAIQTNKYEASAQIYADTSTRFGSLLKELRSDSNEFTVLELVEQSLLNRRELEDVLREAGTFRRSVDAGDRNNFADRVLGGIKLSYSANVLHDKLFINNN